MAVFSSSVRGGSSSTPRSPTVVDGSIVRRWTAMPYSALRKLLRIEWHLNVRSTSPHSSTIRPSWTTTTAADPIESE